MNPFVLAFGRVFGTIVTFVLGPLRSIHEERLPRGGLLIVSNHLSDCDPAFAYIGARRHVTFMAKSELFEMKSIGWFIRAFGAFPVRRGAPDRAALKKAIDYLGQGQTVGIFPEGRLSEDGKLQPLLSGVALIISRAQVPVVCCGLQNTNRVIPYGSMIPRPAFRWVWARFGRVQRFAPEATNEEIMAWLESELRRLTGQ
ncbi:MAG: 1-acyl-sn-glycerol-3-phosphate acyltransferase [Chthonomonas sp.]|nr:1-acyl-sn-glycerol-3-phosphate acyltransferase [Chthonomonas sp.]